MSENRQNCNLTRADRRRIQAALTTQYRCGRCGTAGLQRGAERQRGVVRAAAARDTGGVVGGAGHATPTDRSPIGKEVAQYPTRTSRNHTEPADGRLRLHTVAAFGPNAWHCEAASGCRLFLPRLPRQWWPRTRVDRPGLFFHGPHARPPAHANDRRSGATRTSSASNGRGRMITCGNPTRGRPTASLRR